MSDVRYSHGFGLNTRPRDDKSDFGARQFRRYQLTAALSAGGSASAKVVKWDNQARAFAATSETFTVYSFAGVTGASGDQGFCIYCPDHRSSASSPANGCWEAVAAAGAIAIATLNATLSSGGSAAFTFVLGGTGTGTCYDYLLCASDSLASGTKVVIAKIAGKWVVINAVCPC